MKAAKPGDVYRRSFLPRGENAGQGSRLQAFFRLAVRRVERFGRGQERLIPASKRMVLMRYFTCFEVVCISNLRGFQNSGLKFEIE